MMANAAVKMPSGILEHSRVERCVKTLEQEVAQ